MLTAATPTRPQSQPKAADVIGEVLDRQYVLLEPTQGPGAGFYYVAYDMKSLGRKRLRLLPNDHGAPSLDWYMVDELPRAASEKPALKAVETPAPPTRVPPPAPANEPRTLAVVLSRRPTGPAPRAEQPAAPAATAAKPSALKLAAKIAALKPTGPQPRLSIAPPPLPQDVPPVELAAVELPTVDLLPADLQTIDEPPPAPAEPPKAAEPKAEEPLTIEAANAKRKRPSTAMRLEAAWFAQGTQEESLTEAESIFENVYASIARQAALDDLARVISPEDLREHGLE